MTTKTRHWAGITVGILSLTGYVSAASLGREKYTYDASGNIIEKSIDGKVTNMSYDKENRVTTKQVSGQGLESIRYDAAGRPVTEQNAIGQQVRTTSYGYGDKVMETWKPDSAAGFYYNAEGQLVGINTDGKVSSYTWDGNVIASDGAVAFANEDHISGGVPVLVSGANVVVSDNLGNSLCQGIHQFAETAYGDGGKTGRFTGKLFVKELGSYVFQYRLYSPELNRWTISDPSGFPDGINNQQYVAGDPIGGIDPRGTRIYHGPQDESKSYEATQNQGPPPLGATKTVSFHLKSSYNTIADITDVANGTAEKLTTSSTPDAGATNPTLEYYAPPNTGITRTKYDLKVTAMSGSILLKGFQFNSHSVWIEQ